MKKPIKRKPVPKLASLTKRQTNYRFNAEHADKARAHSRANYRKSKGAEFELTGSVVLRANEFLDHEAKPLVVSNKLTGKTELMPVFRPTYVAKLLNTSYQTIWRWTSETRQLPTPVLFDDTQGRGYGVYHLEEVRVMVDVIGQHLRDFKYYRSDHSGTRSKLFDRIDALRANNYHNQGVPPHGDQTNRQNASSKTGGKPARHKVRRRPGT